MKMELLVSSETSALKAQAPGDYPKDTIRHSTHGGSLKSRRYLFTLPVYRIVSNQQAMTHRCGARQDCVIISEKKVKFVTVAGGGALERCVG